MGLIQALEEDLGIPACSRQKPDLLWHLLRLVIRARNRGIARRLFDRDSARPNRAAIASARIQPTRQNE